MLPDRSVGFGLDIARQTLTETAVVCIARRNLSSSQGDLNSG